MADSKGMVQTVLGNIDPEELGKTLMHEHLLIDEARTFFQLPDEPSKRKLALAPMSVDNIGWVQFNQVSNRDSLLLDDEDMMVEEALRFKHAGGDTIVDVTTVGLSRDPNGLKRISMRTGLNIVSGAGYYVSIAHPPEVASKSVDDIKREITRDVKQGIPSSNVRAGIIGEIGTTWPWGANEEKVLRAAGRAQTETGAPLMVHPGRYPDHPGIILDILEEEHVDMKRTIIAHIERTIGDVAGFKRVMDRGATIEFDLFGQWWYLADLTFPFPNDSHRVHIIKQLVEAGYTDRILMSHDIDTKLHLYRSGNHGYGHILENVVPYMLRNGVSPGTVEQILVENPKRLLTMV